MTTQRLAIGLIILLLSALCIFQTTMSGCSKDTGSDADVTAEETEGEVPFFERSDNESGEPEELDWEPFSNVIVGEIESMFEGSEFRIESIEQASDGIHHFIRCSLEPHPDNSETRQLLDGLHLMYLTFPDQYRYIVEIEGSGNREVEADWNDLKELYELGYSFDTPSAEAEGIWRELFGDGESDWDSGNDMMVRTGKGM